MERRHALSMLFGSAAIAGLYGCEERAAARKVTERAPKYPFIPPLAGLAPKPAVIHVLLEQLRESFEAKGNSVSAQLQPPIDPDRLKELCAWFPGAISPEIFALYSWQGGQQLSDDQDFSPFWFRDMVFSTPETAGQQYASMMETYGKLLPPELTGIDLSLSFPFAAFNGGWYVFPCGGQALDLAHPRSIVGVFQGISVYFHSMEAMLKTCIDWVNHPAYSEQGRDWEAIELEGWKRHNPGIFDNSP